MEDFIVAPMVIVVGIGLHFVLTRKFTVAEGQVLNLSFFAHIASAFAQILIYQYYYGSGDMMAYRDFGIPIAEALRGNFDFIFPETVKVLFQSPDARLPFETMGGGSTGTMMMIATYLLFLLNNSFYGVTLLIAIGSYGAKAFIYRALGPEFAPEHRKTVMYAVMLTPTAVFWTCALLKEPVVMIFMGPLFLGMRYIIDGRIIRGVVFAALGVVGVALLKPYILLSFSAAGAVWLIWERAIRSKGHMAVKPMYFVIGAVVGGLFFVVAQRYLSNRGGDLTSSMAMQRRLSGQVEGDSNFSIEDTPKGVNEESSLGEEIALAPIALISALFRPFIFETRKVMQFINSLETTWVLWRTIQIFRRNRAFGVWARVTASPVLMFCTVFTLILALGTGLSTANMGALSRYRAPMMPFLVVLLVALTARTEPKKEPQGFGAQLPTA